MEQALSQLPLSGPPAAEANDDRPVEVQIAEALDLVALEMVRRLRGAIATNNMLKADDLKIYAETFKLGRDWLLARKKVKKGDEPEDDAAIESAKAAFDKLTKAQSPPKYGDAIAGRRPPPKRVGKPTNEHKAQRDEYNKLLSAAKAKYEQDDDSILNAKLKAVGVS